MNTNDVIVNNIPIDIFELFLNNGGDVTLENHDSDINIHIDSKNAIEYYEKYFISVIQEQKISGELIKHIPIYVDSSKKTLISVLEIEKLVKENVLEQMMFYITPFDFGDGMEDYLVLEIPRTMCNEMVKIDQDLKTNIPAGILSFSVDLMYLLIADERFENHKSFNFVTDINNGDVKGIIQEPDYKEGGNVKILQLY